MKKIMKRKTALILGFIFFILVAGAVYAYIDKNYQKQYEEFPKLSLVLPSGEEIEMLPVEYNWTYKNDNKVLTPNADIKIMNFPKEYTAFVPITKQVDYFNDAIKLKTNVKYKTNSISHQDYVFLNNIPQNATTGSSYGDLSDLLSKGNYLLENPNTIGEGLIVVEIDYKEQGKVKYALKTITYRESTAKLAKQYINTNLKDLSKIEELVKRLPFKEFLKNVNIEDSNLILEYEYAINKEAVAMNNLAIFTCVPELKTITYTSQNIKTYTFDEEFQETKIIDSKPISFTREDVDSTSLANIENLKSYMESL